MNDSEWVCENHSLGTGTSHNRGSSRHQPKMADSAPVYTDSESWLLCCTNIVHAEVLVPMYYLNWFQKQLKKVASVETHGKMLIYILVVGLTFKTHFCQKISSFLLKS